MSGERNEFRPTEIKKESPNEGTETTHLSIYNHFLTPYKKRIPE